MPTEVLDGLLDTARRTPSAGFTQGTSFLVLDDAEAVASYWDTTLAPSARLQFPWPGLLVAPVLVVPLAHADAYLERYSESDKAASGLGETAAAWAVPYWTVDTSFAAMNLLLAAEDVGLGALFFGIFDHTDAVRQVFGIPQSVLPIGTIALGYRAGEDRKSRSVTERGRRPLESVVHRGRYRPGGAAGAHG